MYRRCVQCAFPTLIIPCPEFFSNFPIIHEKRGKYGKYREKHVYIL